MLWTKYLIMRNEISEYCKYILSISVAILRNCSRIFIYLKLISCSGKMIFRKGTEITLTKGRDH